MTTLNIKTINKTLEGSKAIQLHKSSFEYYLANTPKDDPLYDELQQLIKLSSQCENVEFSVGSEDALIINQFNALSDQLSNKLSGIVMASA
ncbi:hypothetical protein [Vibrio sp. 10N.261.55.A7]|uniref:hypothetical protein n=1 Tax=Vibrio sp. 10N.261.55.A7 TaxID=1880851 RepID=UPI000C81D478|nr:hypothetical protein [Vibrio sp. 10N.261.55.A7]PMK03337.1 hypothetical protein BCU12_17375 [Vibrio sp. 10N.261.55.A7]